MRSDTLALRDRILAATREAATWVTTTHIAQKAGHYYVWQKCRDEHPENAAYSYTCDGKVDLVQVPLTVGHKCWRELVALEKQGLVKKLANPGSVTLWCYVTPDDDPTEMLHHLWDTPARDRG